MGFLKLRHGSEIIILVGNNGAVVVNVVGGEVHDKCFVESLRSKEWNCVKSCILSNKKSKVYFVLDHSSQVYTRHSIPAASAFVAQSIAKEKSNNVVSCSELSAAFLSSERPNDDGSWEYVFVEGSIQDELFKGLLELSSEHLLGGFRGALLLSVELASIAREIGSKGGLSQKKWMIFMVYTKAGDFRQVVLRNGELFSSLAVDVLDDEREMSDIVAGKVHQEIQNSLQSIGATGEACDNSDVGICLVVSGNVKSSLLAFDFKGVCINILTPYELGKLLDTKGCVGVSGVYCDTVILYHIARRAKHTLLLRTKDTIAFSRAQALRNVGIIPTCFAAFMVAVLNTLWLVEISNYKSREPGLRTKVEHLTGELSRLRNDREFIKVNEMYEAVDLYRLLSAASPCPLRNAVAPLNRLNEKNFDITSFSWSANEDLKIVIKLGVDIKSEDSETVVRKLSGVFTDYEVRVVPNAGSTADVYLERG
ncbi:hypothetical protein [Anaplasma capra]|uniref:hypothetical protein n=1 Tax=Anaplasma capra TaxID=1562740 RepID=UPI0021D6072B|nr:hypothetical protein [Anaplasma capra]MCU7611868.1 hypothetical protein [Anaplasma capra]MCU7612656.1 hypothetical protein [Anaplasma capra]